MTARAAFLLGLFLVLAALVHGGFYAAGHDFVVNRFTGRFQFVPAQDEDEADTPVGSARALTPRIRSRSVRRRKRSASRPPSRRRRSPRRARHASARRQPAPSPEFAPGRVDTPVSRQYEAVRAAAYPSG